MCRKLLVDVTLEVPGKLIIAELLFAWRCFDTLKSNVINYCFTFNLLLSVKIKLYLYKMAPEQDRKSGGKEVWLIPKLSNSHKELTQGSTHWEVGNLLVLGHWTKDKAERNVTTSSMFCVSLLVCSSSTWIDVLVIGMIVATHLETWLSFY